MYTKSIHVAVMAVAISVIGVGCRVSTKAENFVNEINGASNGAGYVSLVKDPTRVGKYIIVADNGQYYAVKTYGNEHFFTPDENPYDYYVANRISVVPDRNGYYISAGGTLYEATQGDTRDLEKAGAIEEAVQIARMGEFVSAQYGLSEERSREVARSVRTWKEVSRNRGVTQADWNVLSNQLLGTGADAAESAYAAFQKGDRAQMDALIQKGAAVNGVSPEHMRAIAEEFLGN